MASNSDTHVADALQIALRGLEVDEDTFESLRDMVAQADADAGKDVEHTALAATLQELLEPFLLAFGADPASIPASCRQVVVALRGIPGLPGKAKPAAVPAAVPVKEVPKAEPKAAGGLTLAEVCRGARSTAEPKAERKPEPQPKALGSLAALWSAKADPRGEAMAGWGDGLREDVEDDNIQFGDENLGEALNEDGKARGRGRGSGRGRGRGYTGAEAEAKEDEKEGLKKLGGRKAKAKAAPAANSPENLQDVAALGLQGSVDMTDNGHKFAHVEGPGSRNIHLEGVTLVVPGEQGEQQLLKDTDLNLNAGHIYGLVGKNGSGKTTLLRRLATRTLPGLPSHLRFGYVAQELAALKEDQTALEAVVHADEERRLLLKEHEELEAQLAGAEQLRDAAALAKAEKLARRYEEVQQQLELIDADGAEDRAREVLARLHFSEAQMRCPVAELSGGWKMRVALCQALFRRPDVLLLDEPTNHLDLHGVLWLQEHLRKEFGAASVKKDRIVVAVSHDRSFLDGCATDILEIHKCKLRNFNGNYSNYVERIADEQRLAVSAKDAAEKEERKLKQELSALKKKARQHDDDKKVRQLKSKEKKAERGFRLTSERESADQEEMVARLREDAQLRFRFPDVQPVADANLLELDNASVRQGRAVILQGLTLTLDASSRVAVVGGNGAGKSTLLKALSGHLKAEEGPRGRGRKHPAYDPGYVTQNHLESQAAHLHLSLMDFLRDQLPDEKAVKNAHLTKQTEDPILRAHLGNFGLGRDALKKVGALSGGQRARLSLATATAQRPSVLLLDEPTNHLDVDSLDALTLGLQYYEGAVVVVSHNRGFVEALCDELWIIEKGTVKACPKGDDAFAEYFSDYVKSIALSL